MKKKSTKKMSLLKTEDSDITVLSDTEPDSDTEEELYSINDATALLQHKQVTSSPGTPTNKVNGTTTTKNGCVISLRTAADGEPSSPLLSHLEESETLKQKQKTELFSCLAIAVVCLFQAVAFPLQSLEALLLNVHGADLQYAVAISIYATFLISCLLTPAIVRLIGLKWTISLGCTGSFLYVVVRLAPEPALVVGGALFAGLTQGALLGSAGVLITHHATQFAVFGGHSLADVLGLFNGLFYAWYLGAPFINSALRLAILPPKIEEPETSHSNDTVPDFSHCGINYCWDNGDADDVGNATFSGGGDPADKYRMQALLGTHIVCVLGAWLLALLALDRNARRGTDYNGGLTKKEESRWTFVKSLQLAGTVVQWADVSFGMLLMMMLYIGIQQVVGYQVVLSAFVECERNAIQALLVALCISAASMLTSLPIGYVSRYVGRVKFIVSALLIELGVAITLLAWKQPPHAVYYVSMTLWGVADATLQMELAAMVGLLFPGALEGSFAGMRFWQVVGHTILYIMRLYLCAAVVLAVACMLLFIASVIYIALEITIRLQEQERKSSKALDQKYVLPEFAAWIPHFNPHHKGTTMDLCTKHGPGAEDLIST